MSNHVDYELSYTIVPIESIQISPSFPLICQGNSYYLGKIITPIEAYYESVGWSSDNKSIVTVDNDGRITGISPGTAHVTATIGKVSATVPVTVYSIESNVNDSQENTELTNTAGKIIDDIVNNDNPNLEKTDINRDDVSEIRDDIVDGITNGDSFHTDVVAIQQQFGQYKNDWEQIQKATKDLNAKFEGAYNIEVEMYHEDDEDNDHHIGNITELDNEITFTFDLPEGMTEHQSNENKGYVLVRVHKYADGTTDYSQVDYTINDDGTFTATSDKYSDFIWCSVDAKYAPKKNPTTPKSTWVKEGNNWYYYDTNGKKMTGWQKIGAWYYFDSKGVMQTGWIKDGSSWYYLSPSGAMVTGWMKVGNTWYFFSASGAMASNCWVKSGNSWYYMNSSGAMATGWISDGGKWYFLSSSGAMVTGWIKSGDAWYYMSNSGAMVTGWQQLGGKWYYFESSGAMKTGWVQSGKNWYYMNPSGEMVTGKVTIAGKTSKFSDSGVWLGYV